MTKQQRCFCFEYLHGLKSRWVGTGFGAFSYDNFFLTEKNKIKIFPSNPKRSLTCLSRILCFLADIQVQGTEQTDDYGKLNNFLLFCQISIPMCGQEKELWNELSSCVLWLLLFFSLHTGHLRPGHLSCQCNLRPISLVTEKVMRCHHPLLLSYTFAKWKYNSRKNITGL